jgi:AcrR family transcriptional regulator
MGGTPKKRLPRGSLDREAIIAASLRVLEEHGTKGFSMPALGRELGADPTAVYRHFVNRDELILAISDEFIAQHDISSLQADCWVETLAAVARRLWSLGEEKPALMALTASRTAAMPETFQAVNFLVGVLREAGFEPADAALYYRSFIDFVLASTQQQAILLDLSPEGQDIDAGQVAAFRGADPDRYPNIAAAAETIGGIEQADVFELSLSLLLHAIEGQAPHRCEGHEHSLRGLPGGVPASK